MDITQDPPTLNLKPGIPEELLRAGTWSEFDVIFLQRNCGCPEAAAAAGETADLYECEKCEPALAAAARAEANEPDRTDPGYWLDNF